MKTRLELDPRAATGSPGRLNGAHASWCLRAVRIRAGLVGLLALLASVVPPASAHAADSPTRLTLESELVTFHYPQGYQGLIEQLAERTDSELPTLARRLGMPMFARAEVYLIPRKSGVDPSDWGVPHGPEWAAGITLSDRPVIVLYTADTSGMGAGNVRLVLIHEYVHLLVMEGMGTRRRELPLWFQEGSARFLAREWSMVDSVSSLRFALGRRYIPLDELVHSFPSESGRASDAYLESRAFVSFLVERGGITSIRKIHQRVLRGESFHEAMYRVFGVRLQTLEAEWKKDFLRRHRWLPLLTSASTPWLVMIVLFLLGAYKKRQRSALRLKEMEEEEEREDALEAAARLAERESPPPEDL